MASRHPLGPRRFWRLVGLLFLHVVLGLTVFAIADSVWASRSHYRAPGFFGGGCAGAPTAGVVRVAGLAAFAAWFLAAVVLVRFWAARRRFKWLPSVVWAVLALCVTLPVIAIWQTSNSYYSCS